MNVLQWIEDGAELAYEWIVLPVLNGILSIFDMLFTGLTFLIVEPFEALIQAITDTQFFDSMITALTDAEGGLPYLMNSITILGHLLEWSWIVTTLSGCFLVTFAMLIFKVVVKLIPTVW